MAGLWAVVRLACRPPPSVAAPRLMEFPSAGGAGPATREEFRPPGGREPPARRVQMGEGTDEFRPGSGREPPFPGALIQQPREEAVAPAVRDAFRPPGGREPPLRHTTHRLPDYVPLDVTRDAIHGGAREERAPPASNSSKEKGLN